MKLGASRSTRLQVWYCSNHSAMPCGSIKFTDFFFNYYSQTPLYGHPLNTDTSLLRTISFVPGEINSVTFSLKSTHFIRTPRQYGHFLWPCYCPNQCGLTVFLSTSSQFPLGVALDTSIQIRSGPCRRGLVFLKQNILHTFQGHPTQRPFLENMCVVKFLACLTPLGFSNI